MIEIWGRSNAYNVQKVLWLLQELKLEYVHHDLGSTPGDLETPAFLLLNPHARIPVLRDDTVVVWESNSIVRYLAASYANGSLWPASAADRSYAERWMDWELSKLQPDFIDLFWNYYRTPAESRNQQIIDIAQQSCAQHFQIFDRQLANRSYIAGEVFTVGDIACAVCLYRYFEMGLAVERPEYVEHWYQRLSERDPFRRVVMQDFDELKGRSNF